MGRAPRILCHMDLDNSLMDTKRTEKGEEDLGYGPAREDVYARIGHRIAKRELVMTRNQGNGRYTRIMNEHTTKTGAQRFT